jgi:uncharacterized membrane protein YeaQ/YmgE (transglycosylase-associated protein family)
MMNTIKFTTRGFNYALGSLVALLALLPIATAANAAYILSSQETLIPVILGAVCGAAASVLIPTDVDASLRFPILTKIVVGISLGILCPLTWEAYDPVMTANKLALPALIIALFGTPISCFLVSLVCEPLAWKIALALIGRRFGFDINVDALFQEFEEKRAAQNKISAEKANRADISALRLPANCGTRIKPR